MDKYILITLKNTAPDKIRRAALAHVVQHQAVQSVETFQQHPVSVEFVPPPPPRIFGPSSEEELKEYFQYVEPKAKESFDKPFKELKENEKNPDVERCVSEDEVSGNRTRNEIEGDPASA